MSTQDNKKSRRILTFGVGSLVLLAIGGTLAAVGMSRSVNEIRGIQISKTADAILASAGVEDKNKISLNVTYFDQLADPCVNMYDASQEQALKARQFEWTACDYSNGRLEQGLVDFYLGDNYLPVGKSGFYLPDRGMQDLTRWYENVDGKSQNYAGKLDLTYERDSTSFVYRNDDFYPLDDKSFSAGDFANKDGHNHLFTMTFAIPFKALANGSEQFTIRADDDTFVFIGDKLVLDLGGIHEALTGKFMIADNGEVLTAIDKEEYAYSGIDVQANEETVIRVFHADRDSASSEFGVKLSGMSPEVVNAELADANSSQIAYNPSDPSYAKPLGRSITVRPDGTKGYIILATVEGAAIILVAVLAVAVAHTLVKSKK